jgi:diadenosine tetraphosphate (Ap4A) HIT family hydrolase
MSNVEYIATTAIHRFVDEARSGRLARVVARLRSGWAVLGDPQVLRGYCLLYPDPVVADLHLLTADDRLRFLADVGLLGEAVMQVTNARRINYEMLGNVEPALHAHVIPRYADEPDTLRLRPVWYHDWDAAPRFDPIRDQGLQSALREALASRGAVSA